MFLRDTVTSKEHAAELPDLSENVYVTTVVPMKKALFGVCVLRTNGVLPELSVAVGSVQETKAGLAPVGEETWISSGHSLITGGTLSTAVAKIQNIKT